MKMFFLHSTFNNMSFSTQFTIESFAHSSPMLLLKRKGASKVKCLKQYDSKGGQEWTLAGLWGWHTGRTLSSLPSVIWAGQTLVRLLLDHSGMKCTPWQICKRQLNLHGKIHCHPLWQKTPPGYIPAVIITSDFFLKNR